MHHEFRRVDEETFTLHREFVSSDLMTRYGDPSFRYEPVEVRASAVPDEVRETGETTVTARTKQVIGTEREQRNAEAKIHAQRGPRHA